MRMIEAWNNISWKWHVIDPLRGEQIVLKNEVEMKNEKDLKEEEMNILVS